MTRIVDKCAITQLKLGGVAKVRWVAYPEIHTQYIRIIISQSCPFACKYDIWKKHDENEKEYIEDIFHGASNAKWFNPVRKFPAS